jgi:transcriptional regulator with XRE-family HTH domain
VWVDQKKYGALGAVLAAARGKVGLTQKQLSKRLGKPQSFVSNYERGQRRIDVLELIRIAEVLNADPGKLFGEVKRVLGSRR